MNIHCRLQREKLPELSAFPVNRSRRQYNKVFRVLIGQFKFAGIPQVFKEEIIHLSCRLSSSLILLFLFVYIFHLFYCLQSLFLAQAISFINKKYYLKWSSSFASTRVLINNKKRLQKDKDISVSSNQPSRLICFLRSVFSTNKVKVLFYTWHSKGACALAIASLAVSGGSLRLTASSVRQPTSRPGYKVSRYSLEWSTVTWDSKATAHSPLEGWQWNCG